MELRKRLERSDLLASLLGRLVAGYIRFCRITTRWTSAGMTQLDAALADGPVIVVMWHSRILLAPAHVEGRGRFTTLRDPSPAGRVSAAMQQRFGFHPIAMAGNASNRAASREVLRRLKDGYSIGLTADGPLGPAQVAKAAPLDWARVTGVPVFFYAFATTRGRRLGTWDRMLLPLPFGRGAFAFARWDETPPRKAEAAELETWLDRFETALVDHQAKVDAMLGLPPGP